MTTKNPSGLVCYFCGGRFAKLTDGFLQFGDQEIGPSYKSKPIVVFNQHGGRKEVGAIVYPGHAKACGWEKEQSIAFVAHADCGPETYWLSFEQILQEGADHFNRHINQKVWWFLGVPEGLQFVESKAQLLPGGKACWEGGAELRRRYREDQASL